MDHNKQARARLISSPVTRGHGDHAILIGRALARSLWSVGGPARSRLSHDFADDPSADIAYDIAYDSNFVVCRTGPIKGLSKKVECMVASSTHPLYNHTTRPMLRIDNVSLNGGSTYLLGLI